LERDPRARGAASGSGTDTSFHLCPICLRCRAKHLHDELLYSQIACASPRPLAISVSLSQRWRTRSLLLLLGSWPNYTREILPWVLSRVSELIYSLQRATNRADHCWHCRVRLRPPLKSRFRLISVLQLDSVPGSGKSTLAYPLVDRLNALLGIPVREPSRIDAEELVATPGRDQVEAVAVAVGLDGWHFTRAELDTFPVSFLQSSARDAAVFNREQDPAEARRRRGAAFTFDSVAYTSFVLSLRKIPLLPSIPFPTFSHSLKDPTLSPFTIKPHHRIVVIEGLYCLLDVEPWKSSVDVLDERVWVECERAVARERLVRRHLKEGVEDQLDKAEGRGGVSLRTNSR
jgi:hypothetical protein